MMHSSTTLRAFRSTRTRLNAAAAVPLLLLLVASAGAAPGNDRPLPDLGDCSQLQVDPGNRVSFHGFGVGVQIYQWNGTTWKFVAPEATLFANAGDDSVVAIHFGGPTWQSNSGGKVVGSTIAQCTPDPTAIPWLKLAAASTEGPGPFADVTFIQRLNTVGGIAPSTPGEFVGQIARVPYTSDYFFYRKAGQ